MTKFPFESLAGVKRSPQAEQGAAVFVIQPKAAQFMLDNHNTGNRNIRSNHVMALASAMTSKRFLLNGDTVVISDIDRVINGQHRLTACVNSGIPITTWVVWGVPDPHYQTIDQVVMRKASDHIKSMGCTSSYAGQAIISTVIRSQLRQLGFAGAWDYTIQASVIAEFYSEFQEATEQTIHAAAAVYRLGKQPGGTPFTNGAIGVVLLPLVIQDRDWFLLAKEWLSAVATGDGINKGTPGYALRRALCDGTNRRNKGSYDKAKMTLKAWNAHARSEPMLQLKLGENEESIPVPTLPLDSKTIRDLFHARYVPAEEPK